MPLPYLKIGTRVKITNCILEELIGKRGKIFEKRKGVYTDSNYNIKIGKMKIWMSEDNLEVLG